MLRVKETTGCHGKLQTEAAKIVVVASSDPLCGEVVVAVLGGFREGCGVDSLQVAAQLCQVLSVQQPSFPLAQMTVPGQDFEAASQFPQAVSVHVHGVRPFRVTGAAMMMLMMLMVRPEPALALAGRMS